MIITDGCGEGCGLLWFNHSLPLNVSLIESIHQAQHLKADGFAVSLEKNMSFEI